MNRTRLVKRREGPEQEQSPSAEEPQPSIVQTTVDTVLEWRKTRQAGSRVNPREMFAALFAPAQTE
jgi:hypothetical protein